MVPESISAWMGNIGSVRQNYEPYCAWNNLRGQRTTFAWM